MHAVRTMKCVARPFVLFGTLPFVTVMVACAGPAPFVGPRDPPSPLPTASASSDPASDDAGPTPAGSSASPSQDGRLLTSQEGPQPDLMSCGDLGVRLQRVVNKAALDCFRSTSPKETALGGTLTAFHTEKGTLLTVRTLMSPFSATFGGCVEMRARQYLRLHPGCASGRTKASFHVDASHIR